MVRRFGLRKGSEGMLGKFVLFTLLAGLLVCNGCDLFEDEDEEFIGSEVADADYSGSYNVTSETTTSGVSQINVTYDPGTNPPATEVWITNIEYDVTTRQEWTPGFFGVGRIVLYHDFHSIGPSRVTATDNKGGSYTGVVSGNRMVLHNGITVRGTFASTSTLVGTATKGGDTRNVRLTK